jgi:hypothetical protein
VVNALRDSGAPRVLRVGSWNHRRTRHPGQVAFLRELGLDILLLQDVSVASFDRVAALLADGTFAWGLHSLSLRPNGLGEGGSRAKGTAIFGSGLVQLEDGPLLLKAVPAPERTLVVGVSIDGQGLTLASINLVAGDSRDKNWGPAAKAQFFSGLASWMERQRHRTIIGMDCNSPRIDHPDVRRNEYWFGRIPGDQNEHLVHDPSASHSMSDVYRVYLAEHPEELASIIATRPNGPLAVSHVNVSKVRSERRYDFIYVTPDLKPRTVRYLGDEVGLGRPRAMSDHALVLATLLAT